MPKTLQDVSDATNSCAGLPFLRIVYRVPTGGRSDFGVPTHSGDDELPVKPWTSHSSEHSTVVDLLPTDGDRDSATFDVHVAPFLLSCINLPWGRVGGEDPPHGVSSHQLPFVRHDDH